MATRYRSPRKGLVVGKLKRALVFERDGWKCVTCGRVNGEHYQNRRGKRAETALEIDHIIPRSAGGTSDLDNLQTLCSSCNGKKGAQI